MMRPARKNELEKIFYHDSELDLEVGINKLLTSQEYLQMSQNISHPPGHFYSPIVNIAELEPRADKLYKNKNAFDFIMINDEDMLNTWHSIKGYVDETKFYLAEEKPEDVRYFYGSGNRSYPLSDAAILQSLIRKHKPKRIIEVGSGFTSAVILDTQDCYLDYEIDLTFIQPFPHTIERILKKSDSEKYSLIQSFVQDVDISLFSTLQEDDILFIDSTHVVKTGSDVVHEVLNILPYLNPGVIIHFHDIFYPFEYSKDWIFNKAFSWNEIYLLRSFLMFNDHFKVLMFTNHFNRNLLDKKCKWYQEISNSKGGSFWLQKIK